MPASEAEVRKAFSMTLARNYPLDKTPNLAEIARLIYTQNLQDCVSPLEVLVSWHFYNMEHHGAGRALFHKAGGMPLRWNTPDPTPQEASDMLDEYRLHLQCRMVDEARMRLRFGTLCRNKKLLHNLAAEERYILCQRAHYAHLLRELEPITAANVLDTWQIARFFHLWPFILPV